MQTVIVTFENQAFTFDVYDRKELDKKAFFALVHDNGPKATRIGSEEWQDGGMYRVEKLAAKEAGLENQTVLVIRK